MKRLFHLGGSVLTGDELADALLVYAQALANRGETGIADIPIVDDDGVAGRAMILVGPGTQLTSVTESTSADDVLDPAAVDELHRGVVTGAAAVSTAGYNRSRPWDQFEFDF